MIKYVGHMKHDRKWWNISDLEHGAMPVLWFEILGSIWWCDSQILQIIGYDITCLIMYICLYTNICQRFLQHFQAKSIQFINAVFMNYTTVCSQRLVFTKDSSGGNQCIWLSSSYPPPWRLAPRRTTRVPQVRPFYRWDKGTLRWKDVGPPWCKDK